MVKEQLQAAPADSTKKLTENDGIAYRDRSYDYNMAAPYWS